MGLRVFLFAWLFLVAVPTTQAAEPEPRTVALVGKLVSIKDHESPCNLRNFDKALASDRKLDCIPIDSLFKASYEIVEVLSGEIRSADLKFSIADHYGFPRFAEYQYALLFVDIGAKENWLVKYRGYAVHRTSTGGWASCGNPYDELLGEAPNGLVPVSFAKDIGAVGELDRDGVEKRFDSKSMVVEGEKIVCRTGVPVANLYEQVRTDFMAAGGIQLPPLATFQNKP